MARSGSRARIVTIAGRQSPLLVWGMFGLVTVAVLITYARIPTTELYHVSRTGIAGGASRALVYLNFPVAFAAIALLGVATVALFDLHSLGVRKRRLVAVTAVVALVLCLIAALPGVVRQSDLDARLINALPALGVLLALAVSIGAMRLSVPPVAPPRTWRDPFTIIASVVLLMLAIPWMLADLGVYTGDVPLLGRFVMSKEFVPAGSTLPAVHLGHHHGLDGVCFAAGALILGRTLDQFRPGRLRSAVAWYLALLLVYGLANFANDFWLEQIVKRGWTARQIPSMLLPEVSTAWGLVLLGVVAARSTLFRVPNQRPERTPGVLPIPARRGD